MALTIGVGFIKGLAFNVRYVTDSPSGLLAKDSACESA